MSHPRIELIQGDTTKQKLDAIVNAANTTLLGEGRPRPDRPGYCSQPQLGPRGRSSSGQPREVGRDVIFLVGVSP